MPNEVETSKRREALEAVRRFVEASGDAENVTGLLAASDCGGICWASLETPNGEPAVVSFTLHREGEPHKCLCNPATFAVLLCIIGLGQTVFINDNGDDRYLYVKICGKMNDKAGYIFARFICTALRGEQVKYRNDNRFDLCHSELRIPQRDTTRAAAENASEPVADLEDRTRPMMMAVIAAEAISEKAPIFPGEPAEQSAAAWALLDGAVGLMDSERSAAVGAGA